MNAPYENIKKTSRGAKNLRIQISVLCKTNNQKHAVKNKIVSDITQNARWHCLVNTMEVLHDELGYKITDVNNIGQKHIYAVAKYWIEVLKLSPGSINNYYSILNTFFSKWLKKPSLMPSKLELFKDPKHYTRGTATTCEKSCTSSGIDINEVIEKLFERNKYKGIQLLLAYAFGLRLKECMCFRPITDDLGDEIQVVKGAKNGHKRYVPIRNAAQREVLDMAKKFVDPKNTHGSTIPREYDLKTWYNKMRYGIRRYAGLTSKKLNATTKYLRDEYALNRFEELTGLDAPIRFAGRYTQDQLLKVKRGFRQVSSELGHSRESITTAYVGSCSQRLSSVTQRRGQSKIPGLD